MSTITREFTKEQLMVRAKARLEHMQEAMRDHSGSPDARMDLHLAEIALASLEAEAVGFIARHKETGKFGSYLHPKADWFKNGEYEVLNAYTAPPAPVSVPDALAGDIDGDDNPLLWSYNNGWNACRAAMLQSFGNSEQLNCPVIPDGYCIMPLKLTADNGAKGALCGEFHVQYRIVCQSCVGEGCEDCNHTGGWDAELPVGWDTIKRIHESAVEACALSAAQQQEAE